MKKLKKVLSWILAATMLLSTLTAFAAEPTINTDKDVSLTIYKYRYDGDEGVVGTGVIGDESKVPAEAVLLNGVTFAVYKVADIIQEEDGLEYSTVAAIRNEVGATINGGMSAADIQAQFSESVLSKLTPVEKTTATVDGKDGVAKFTNADLSGQGLYLVVETNAPESVAGMVDPFLVSLPMTNVEGTDWIYDVYAFPKNTTAASTVTLKKYGKTGDGSAVGVNGAQFVLQKKVNGVWTTQTKNDDGDDIGTNGVITMSNTSIKISGLSDGEYRFIEISAPSTDYIMDGTAVYEFTVGADGTVTVDGKKTSTVSVVNFKPELEKKVLVKNGSMDQESDWQDAADYSVGDRVPFKVTSTVPENINQLKHYVLVDTMSSGLTMDSTDQASFVVSYYVGTSKVTDTGITTKPVYDAAKNQWTLDLSGDVEKLYNKSISSVEVTFTATLNANALTAGAGNPNTVGLEYTNKIYPKPGDDDQNPNTPGDDSQPYEETKTITDKVIVYTFGLDLVKTFAGSAASDTIKATFDLYRPLVSGETKETTLKVNGTNVDVKKVGTYTTDANGKITINTTQSGDNDKAFSNETYYFVETATASGYNLLKEPIAVKIQIYYDQTFKTTTTETKYDKNGNVIGTPTVTESGTDKTTYYTDAAKTSVATTTTTTVNVVNKKGFVLPTTGGAGTLVFSLIGIVLMAAAVIVFFGARKRSHA